MKHGDSDVGSVSILCTMKSVRFIPLLVVAWLGGAECFTRPILFHQNLRSSPARSRDIMSPQIRNTAGGFGSHFRKHDNKSMSVTTATMMAASTGGSRERTALTKGAKEKIDPYAIEAQLVEEDKTMWVNLLFCAERSVGWILWGCVESDQDLRFPLASSFSAPSTCVSYKQTTMNHKQELVKEMNPRPCPPPHGLSSIVRQYGQAKVLWASTVIAILFKPVVLSAPVCSAIENSHQHALNTHCMEDVL